MRNAASQIRQTLRLLRAPRREERPEDPAGVQKSPKGLEANPRRHRRRARNYPLRRKETSSPVEGSLQPFPCPRTPGRLLRGCVARKARNAFWVLGGNVVKKERAAVQRATFTTTANLEAESTRLSRKSRDFCSLATWHTDRLTFGTRYAPLFLRASSRR